MRGAECSSTKQSQKDCPPKRRIHAYLQRPSLHARTIGRRRTDAQCSGLGALERGFETRLRAKGNVLGLGGEPAGKRDVGDMCAGRRDDGALQRRWLLRCWGLGNAKGRRFVNGQFLCRYLDGTRRRGSWPGVSCQCSSSRLFSSRSATGVRAPYTPDSSRPLRPHQSERKRNRNLEKEKNIFVLSAHYRTHPRAIPIPSPTSQTHVLPPATLHPCTSPSPFVSAASKRSRPAKGKRAPARTTLASGDHGRVEGKGSCFNREADNTHARTHSRAHSTKIKTSAHPSPGPQTQTETRAD